MPITQILLTATTAQGGGGGGGGGGSAADFTVEWFQKVENNFSNARPWSIGLYPTQIIAVSYESMSSDYYWINNSIVGNTPQNHVGAGWRHMAYVRRSGVVYGYVNGTEYFSASNTDLITNTTTPLYVGTGEIGAGTYRGYITNLHIMRSVAKYTGNFTPPTSPIVATTGSIFLMNVSNSGDPFNDSVGGKVTQGVTGSPAHSSDSPFTALGPYTALYPVSNPDTLYFLKTSYPDIENVQAGWSATADDFSGTVTNRTSTDPLYHIVTINVASGSFGGASVTFTQPGLGSVYFDGTSYVNYGASAEWAMDAP
jgi:hypothetical protein